MNTRNILTALAILFTFINLSAQQFSNVEERLAEYKEKLNLTEEQTQAIEEILLDSKEAFQKIREENSGDRAAMINDTKELMSQTNSKIKEQLTDEQKVIFNQMIEEKKQEFLSRKRRR